MFDGTAGLVAVDILHEGGSVIGAALLSPQPLTRHGEVDPARAADCLGLGPAEVRIDAHGPQVASAGPPFFLVELASRVSLRRARHNRAAYNALFSLDGARSVHANVQA